MGHSPAIIIRSMIRAVTEGRAKSSESQGKKEDNGAQGNEAESMFRRPPGSPVEGEGETRGAV